MEKRNAYKVFVGKPGTETPPGKSKGRWEHDIKTD
jgi:hypothetical protein